MFCVYMGALTTLHPGIPIEFLFWNHGIQLDFISKFSCKRVQLSIIASSVPYN